MTEETERRDRPPPRPEPPEAEQVDRHTGPLDNDDDARWLRDDDPRRLEVERRRARPFDQDAESEGGED